MTTYPLIDCVTFLLNEGVDYVLTESFCQHDLENDLGIQMCKHSFIRKI